MTFQTLPPRDQPQNGFFFPFLIFAEIVLVLLILLSLLTGNESRESTIKDFHPGGLKSARSSMNETTR